MLDQVIIDYADSLFNQTRREIYDQEEEDLEVIRKSNTRNGMVHVPQYVTEVGKYLVKRTSTLSDAKRESLFKAIKRAGLPLDETVLGLVTSMVMDFCNRQQHQEIAFMSNHTAKPWLSSVSGDMKAAVSMRIQTGISHVMEAAKDKLNVIRLEVTLDARNYQAVYASGLGKPWDVFISHASEDKEGFVEPLAKALSSSGLNVV